MQVSRQGSAGTRSRALWRAALLLVLLMAAAPALGAAALRLEPGGGSATSREIRPAAPAPAPAPGVTTPAAPPTAPAGAERIYKDIPYEAAAGVDPAQLSLDVYTRDGARDLPIAVFVHGGGWSGGDKANVRHHDKALLGAGYIFISVNYRLLPAGRHPTNAQDLAHALAWIHRNAGRYGGDASRIYVIGHSAGAHLAALVATDGRYLKAAGESLALIKGVVVLDSAAYDVARLLPQLSDPNNLYAVAFGADRAVWADASPTSHISAGKGIPPFLVVHAGNDRIRLDQAEHLAGLLRAAGVRADRFEAPERDHGALCDLFGSAGDRTTSATIEFLGSIGAIR